MTMRNEFCLALNADDAIVIEWLYVIFLPMFLHTGKKLYFEIISSMIEDLYSKVSYKHLHLVRINRTAPLYEGTDSNDRPMANWGIDTPIESIQKYCHKMNFKIDNLEGWIQHIQHLQMMNKPIRFFHLECNKIKSEVSRLPKDSNRSSAEKDPSKNKKQSSKP